MAKSIKQTLQSSTRPRVHHNVYVDMAGEVVADNDDIVEAYRTLYNETSEVGDTTASDEDILRAVTSVQGDGNVEDVQNARLEAIANIQPPELETAETSKMDDERISVMDIGSLFPTELNAALSSFAGKREDLAGSALVIAHYVESNDKLRKAIDDKNVIPNTKTGDKWKNTKWDPGNTSPDYYERNGGEIKGSFYQDIFDGSQYGRFVQSVRDIIKRASGEKPQFDPGDQQAWDKIVDQYKEIAFDKLSDAKRRLSCKQRWDSRRTDGAARLRAAQKFRLQKKAVEEVNGMHVQMVDDNIDVAAKRRSPLLIVWNPAPGKVEVSDPKSVGTFNRIDVPKARQLAANEKKPVALYHLNATTRRSTRQQPGLSAAEGGGIPDKPNAKQVIVMVDSLYNFLADKKARADFAKALSADDSDEDVATLGDVLDELSRYFRPFQARYDALKAKQEATAATGNGKGKAA